QDMNRPPFEHRSTYVSGWDDRSRFDGRNRSKLSCQSQRVAVDQVDLDVLGAAKGGRSLRDRVKHRLQIGRRTGYDAQDLAGGRLLLQRLGDLSMGVGDRAVLGFQLLEQAHILDGDDGLVGEGLEETNLAIREWTWCCIRPSAPDGNCSD